MPAILDKARARLRGARARLPVFDHAIRAYQHATGVLWGYLAAGITYFGFLSLFPLIAVGFAVLAYLTVVYPDVRDGVEQAVLDAFPGLLGEGDGQINLDSIAAAGRNAGIVGLVALLWTGTGAVDAIRDGVRMVFGTADQRLALPKKKLRDLLIMGTVGLLIVASVAVSTVTTQAASLLLGVVDLDDSVAAQVLLRVLTVGVAVGLNTLVLALLFRVMSGRDLRWDQVWGGALLGAILLEVLKLLATQLLGGALGNPIYRGFAVAVGLLLWINFSARVLILAASWVATERSVLAAEPDVEAVHPAELPLVVAPQLPAPRRRWALPGAAAAVVSLVLLALRRRGATPDGASQR